MNIKENETRTLPEVDFDELNGILKISGKSISSEAAEFYEPVLEYIKEIVKSLDHLEITFDFMYFNTKTVWELMKLLDIIKHIKNLNIIWYYEEDDESMLEAGKDYEEIIGIKFKFIKKEVNL